MPPALNHIDYYNRKGWYFMLIQAVVDHNYMFHDIYVGLPGSVHDACVLANSSLYSKATRREILSGNVVKEHDTVYPYSLLETLPILSALG